MTFSESVKSNWNGGIATFKGRASRSEYWWWVLFLLVFVVGLALLSEYVLMPLFGWGLRAASWFILFGDLAISVRRCHDTNHSGWWILCPVYGVILMFLPGDEGENQYGEKSL